MLNGVTMHAKTLPGETTVKLRLRREDVSERSLEFNVLSEAVERIRRIYGKAYIVGYTTRQEAQHGLDVSINAPGKILSAFQFKAPKAKKGNTYIFSIGDRCWVCSNPNIKKRRDQPGTLAQQIEQLLGQLGLPASCANQHTLLYAVALVFKTKLGIDVHYALPLVKTYAELEQRIPGILQYTISIPVLSLPITTITDCTPHKINITIQGGNPSNTTITIQSKPIKLPQNAYTTLDQLLEEHLKKETLPEAKQEIHIPTEELQELLRRKLLEEAEKQGLPPNQLEKIEKLATALTKINFTYRGTILTTKKQEKQQA